MLNLEQNEHFLRSVDFSISKGSHAEPPSEYPVEMALVRKPGFMSNVAQRPLRRYDLLTSEFKSQPPHIFANRAVHSLAKHARQMCRMHTGRFRNILQSECRRKIV